MLIPKARTNVKLMVADYIDLYISKMLHKLCINIKLIDFLVVAIW